jgi:hypothetical protein
MFCIITTQFSKIILTINIMSYIDLTTTTYSNLNQMAVYAQGTLTATTTGSDPIEVNGGYWAGTPVTEIPSGSLTGLAGEQTNAIFLSDCESELNTLVSAIYSRVSIPNVTPIDNSDRTFTQGNYYDSGTGIEYPNSITLTFDAQDDPNAQFFIWSDYHFTFPNTTFVLTNGAREGNIFFVANSNVGYITITNSSNVNAMIIPCIMIATTFTVSSENTSTKPISLRGAFFSTKFSSLFGDINLTNANTPSLTFTIDKTTASYIGNLSPTYVDLSITSPHLSRFAILGLTSLTTVTSSTDTTISVKDGYWYGGTLSTNPDLVPEGTLSGYNNSPSISPITYTTEFDALISEIINPSVSTDYPDNPITDTNITTFYPNFYYSDGGVGSGITYNSSTTLTFDAKNIDNAQFFINAGTFIFNGTPFILKNGATAGNIFWISSDVSVVNSLVPGIIMSQYGLVDVNITDTNSTILSGHIFSKQDVSVSYTNANGSTNLTIQAAPLSTVIPPTYIDLEVTCPHLLQFSVLSLEGGLTTTAYSASQPININEGYWYGNPVVSNFPLIGNGTLSGFNGDPTIHPIIYADEAAALITEITTITAGNHQQYTNQDTTFYSGIYYENNDASIIYDGSTQLTFDAQGDPKAQFFINTGSFSFTGTRFLLAGLAEAGNIFWLSDGDITINNSSVPGIITAFNGTVSLESNDDRLITISGHIYSKTDISIIIGEVDSPIVIIANPVSTLPPYPPIYTINLVETYPNLLQFAVLAQSQLYTSSPSDDTRPIVINDGYWYGNPVETVTGSLSGTGTLSGYNADPATNTIYLEQLDALINEIFTIISSYVVPINNTTTFYPYQLYQDSNTDIIFDDVTTIIFDAGGNPDAQFFINAKSFTFNATAFTLSGLAEAGNIFWISNNYVGINNSSVPGIVISQDGGSSSDIEILFNATTPMTLKGHLFSKTAISMETLNPVVLRSINAFSGLEVDPLQLTMISDPVYVPSPIPPEPPVVCYAKGTLILTKHGFIPIENMKAGDKVITNGKIYKNKIAKQERPKSEPILWVGKFKVNKLNSSSRPICITKNALANNFPFQDLYVSPNHSMIINGEMVLAKDLVNEVTIYQDMECEDVEYYHLECENHNAIIANGVLSESYLNMDNRSVFENSLKIHRKKYVKPEIKKILL